MSGSPRRGCNLDPGLVVVAVDIIVVLSFPLAMAFTQMPQSPNSLSLIGFVASTKFGWFEGSRASAFHNLHVSVNSSGATGNHGIGVLSAEVV